MTAVELTMGNDSSEKRDKMEKKKKRRKEKSKAAEDEDNHQVTREKEKKSKKKRKHAEKTKDEEETAQPITQQDQKEEPQKDEKELRKRKRQEKKEEKEAILAKLPQVNEDGVAYTKSQIRRMIKRVKHGLTPIPTKKEAQEQSRLEALERKHEETLYFGDGNVDDTNVAEQDDHDNEKKVMKETKNTSTGVVEEIDHVKEERAPEDQRSSSSKKKARCKKPVPDDYVCSACQNKHEPRHWIYDCPDKVTVRGTNAVAKKLRGLHEPNANKLFLSGLPFEYKAKDLEALVSTHDCGKLVHAKLVTFPDTGRCKGQAYITFESEDAAKDALKKLNGQTIAASGQDDKKKKQKGSTQKPKKELRLKVTKVLSRFVTKNRSI